MGFLDGLLSIGSTIFEKVGSAISAGIEALCTVLPPFIDKALKVVSIISDAVVKVCEALEILPFSPNPTELGVKVSQDDTRGIQEGESTKHYLEYLHNDVPISIEKFDNMTDEEKLEYTTIGTGLIKNAIEDEIGIELPAEFLAAIEKIKLEHEQIIKFIEGFKESGVNSMSEFTDYLSGKLDENQVDKIDSIITESLHDLSPGKNAEDIQSEIADMKIQYRIDT